MNHPLGQIMEDLVDCWTSTGHTADTYKSEGKAVAYALAKFGNELSGEATCGRKHGLLWFNCSRKGNCLSSALSVQKMNNLLYYYYRNLEDEYSAKFEIVFLSLIMYGF